MASQQTSPWSHQGPWTADRVLELPEDDIRYEAVDGALIVNPPPTCDHQEASYLLTTLLRTAVRAANLPLKVWEAIGVRLPSEQLLIPDVVVGGRRRGAASPRLLEARNVVLVAEIVSPGSTVR